MIETFCFSCKYLQHDFIAKIATLIFDYLVFIWEISANI